MLYHYFLKQPRALSVFPFFEADFCVLYNYTRYTYLADCLGSFFFPVITAGALTVPLSVRKSSSKRETIIRRWFILLCFILALFVGWQDFCMGGAVTRYVQDILPIMCIGSVVSIIYFVRSENFTGYKFITSSICFMLTFAAGWLYMLSMSDSMLMKRCPELYETVEDMLIFWQ